MPVPPETADQGNRIIDEPLPILLRRSAVGAVGVLALMVVSGLLVEFAVTRSSIGDADLSVTSWLADHRTGAMDAVATVGSSLADTFTVIGVIVGAVTMLAAAGRFRHGLFLLVAVSTEFAAFLATSYLIGRDRPDVEPLGEVPSTGSYPSGHVAVAIVLYGGLTVVAASISRRPGVGRIGCWITAVLALFVGLSRMYEGVHHPLDVLGGVLLGVAALTSAAWAFGLMPEPASEPGPADPRPVATGVAGRPQVIDQ